MILVDANFIVDFYLDNGQHSASARELFFSDSDLELSDVAWIEAQYESVFSW